jgi:hypothetical protein
MESKSQYLARLQKPFTDRMEKRDAIIGTFLLVGTIALMVLAGALLQVKI